MLIKVIDNCKLFDFNKYIWDNSGKLNLWLYQ